MKFCADGTDANRWSEESTCNNKVFPCWTNTDVSLYSLQALLTYFLTKTQLKVSFLSVCRADAHLTSHIPVAINMYSLLGIMTDMYICQWLWVSNALKNMFHKRRN